MKILFNIFSLITYLIINSNECIANSTDVNIPFDHHFHTEPILPFSTWGSFRGLHYFGLRTTSPDSPAIGLVWFTNNAKDIKSLQMRHWCELSDNLIYGWKYHNFNDFGLQTIRDNYYSFNTSFIKFSQNNWKALVEVISNEKTKPKDESISLIIYTSIDRESDLIKLLNNSSNSIQINGFNEYIGKFRLNITSTSKDSLFSGQLITKSSNVKVIENIKNNLKPIEVNGTKIFALKDTIVSNPSTLIAYQVVFKSEAKVMVEFNIENKTEFENKNEDNYEIELNKRIGDFGQEFEKKFGLKAKNFSEKEIEFAKSILSEMIGSIAYFNGNLSVDSPGMTKPVSYGPLEILSAIPSRPVFPHPFLWDEGFHNLLIQRWNSSITLKIMNSWFNLMNIEGWIPREITIGSELIAKFGSVNTQTDVNANPPSFLLTIDSLLRNKQIDVKYLQQIYPKLKAWFQWYNTSQSGQISSTYRWRGRDSDSDERVLNPDTLTSGLDDYPRATHPTDSEYHLDLRCWIALAADVMTRIAEVVGDLSGKVKYEETAKLLTDNQLLDSLHWSEADKAYCDYGLHSTNVSLVNDPKRGWIRKVWTPPKYQFTCDQLGYVNVFPLMFGILDANNPKLSYVLETITNSSKMWTPFGLRSLSKTSFYYNKNNSEYEKPYWRGPIWINLNYLMLKGLQHYSSIPGPNQQKALNAYKELRNNLITNMFKEYTKTGFVWEQYNDITGYGTHSHPFVGWSAVVVLAMAEEY